MAEHRYSNGRRRKANGRRRDQNRSCPRKFPLGFEDLENRLLFATNILTYHNDIASTGQNLAETVLTPSNVNSTQFGKLFSVSNLDGYVYAQPLYDAAVTTTAGTDPGLHNVVYVATEHDSLYAIDADSGTILWQDSFLNSGLPGATQIIPIPSSDANTTDLVPEIGITGTPVIDPSTNTLYLVAATKETVSGTAHYVDRLHAIDITSGAEKFGGPVLIGDTTTTTGGYSNNTPIYVYGNGYQGINGWNDSVTDPYNGTGKQVVQFNVLRELQRAALTLANGAIYLECGGNGELDPWHGWVLSYNPANLALQGVFCTTPNGQAGGIWESGGRIDVDSQGFLYFETGNGTFDGQNNNGSDNSTTPAPGPVTGLDSNGFPVYGDYGDSFVKLAVDSSTSPTNQNQNGWGLKVQDYFTPFNQNVLNSADLDQGSAGPLLLPASAGSTAHPQLLIGSGKEGRIYLIDCDNMGKFGVIDNVVQETDAIAGAWSSPAYFNGSVYFGGSGQGGSGDAFKAFSVSNASFSTSPTSQSSHIFNFPGPTPAVSANGSSAGIVWALDNSGYGSQSPAVLYAYDATNLSNELYDTTQAAGNRDQAAGAVKFTVPTVVNGKVYVGGEDALTVYGLFQPPNAPPQAPSNLTATAFSGSQINLTWTDNDVTPNKADGYYIEQSTDGTNFTRVATAGAGTISYLVGGLALSTTYYFRVQAYNSIGVSAYTNIASATTANQVPLINFSSGFASGTTGVLTFNGGTAVSGNDLQLTDGGSYEARSVFSTSAVGISSFSTAFSFQITAGTNTADGFTFTIQGVGNTALGPAGGGLGYGPDTAGGSGGIPNSVAVKFDLYSNNGEGPDSTGLYTDGAAPTNIGSIDLSSTGINFHSGDVFQANLSYNGSTLTETLTDTQTNATVTETYTVNIGQTVGSSTAYVGFTAGTGGLTATQNILSWTYSLASTSVPASPTNLTATAGNAQVALNWTGSAGATSYNIYRSTTQGGEGSTAYKTGLTSTSFTDTGLTNGTTYYYQVTAVNSAGESGRSSEVSATPASTSVPASPTNLTATAGNAQVALTWTASSGATSYNIYRSTTQGGEGSTAYKTGLTSTSFTDTGLINGTTYYYQVTAVNSAGESGKSSEVSATPASTSVPASPTNLTATAGNAQVALTWTASSGATSYNIYRSTTQGGEGSTAYKTGLTSTSFTDTGLTNGTTYYYQVTAVNSAGESGKSSEVSATPINSTAVINFPSGFASGTAGVLTFNGGTAVSGNDLQLTNGGSNEARSVFSTSAVGISSFSTAFSFQITAGTNTADGFTFTIQGVGNTALGPAGGGLGYGPDTAGGSGGIPNSVAVKFDLYSNNGEGPDSTGLYTDGAAPTNIGSIDLSSTGINFHSGDVFQANLSYNGSTLTETLTDTQTNATVTETYTVNIGQTVGSSTAYVGFTAGTGGLTATQNILSWTYSLASTSVPASPTNLTATAGNAQVALNWTGSAGATSYNIYRSTTQGGEGSTAYKTGLTSTSFTDTGLINGTTYYYQVTAVNSAGESGKSSEVSATPASTSVPASPTNLTATAGNAQVALTWTASSGATSYNIYRSTTQGGEGSTAYKTGLTSTSFTDTGLTNGTTYYYQVTAVNSAGESGKSSEVSATPINSTAVINFPSGFASGTAGVLTFNGGAAVSGNDLQLTNGGSNEARSVFSTSAVGISSFSTAFSFQITAGTNTADGFTFTIQGVGNTALGPAGGGLGYGPDTAGGSGGIPNSVAVKFDLYSNNGEGPDSTGLYTNGAAPTNIGSIDLSSTGINFHSGDVFQANLSYNGSTLTETLTDTQTNATVTETYTVNIGQTVGSSTAYVGFTAGTGGLTATQNILSWTYSLASTSVPASPTNLTATAGNAQVALNWTGSAGAPGYNIYRSTTQGGEGSTAYKTGLTSTSFTDTGLTNGTTYYYQVTAVNSAGESGKSSEVSATPASTSVPASPTNLTATAGNAQVALTWTASSGATSYNIYRSTTQGGEGSTAYKTGLTSTSFADTGLSNGTTYYYQVTAVNSAGESGKSSEVSATPINSTAVINFPSGFASGTAGVLTFNGGAAVSGNDLQLTNGGSNEARSVFSTSAVGISSFSTAFSFQITAGTNTADGFTFTIQGVGNTALGPAGGGLGYGPDTAGGSGGIPNSVAVKFDLYSNNGEGPDSTGLYTDGAAPTNIGSIDLSSTGINFHSGDVFQANLSYNGSTLTETLTDTQTNATVTETYTVNIGQTVGSSTAYVGFTAGTGGLTATQDILTWTYS